MSNSLFNSIIFFILFVFSVSCSIIPQRPEREIREQERASWQEKLLFEYQPEAVYPGKTESIFSRILDDAVKQDTYNRLNEVLVDEAVRHEDEGILFPVQYAFYNPLAIERIRDDLAHWPETLRYRSSNSSAQAYEAIKRFAAEARIHLKTGTERENASLETGPKFGKTNDHSLQGLADNIKSIILASHDRARDAFAAITDEEMDLLQRDIPKILTELVETNVVLQSIKSDDEQPNILHVATKVDIGKLSEAMAILAELTKPSVLKKLGRLDDTDASPAQAFDIDPRFRGHFVLAERTPIGLVLIGGRGPNTYGADAAVIIDLGGNDLYTNNAGAPPYEIQGNIVSITSHLGVIIDLAGNDRYTSNRFASLGTGFIGLGLILDLAGDDLYGGDLLSQGAGVLGIGCLLDMAGNDAYIGKQLGQGAAIFGGGLLLDGGGNDLYSGAKFVQGFGGPIGMGHLVDIKGDDHYVNGGQKGSTYGTPGVFQGYGQGLGWGFRGKAAGGIGILQDFDGDDVYEAGNFAQGTGYYFGLGMLLDQQGNDNYWGSRYCQGSAAHQAVGIFTDQSGNDVYYGQVAANQGAAWDVSIGGFFDHAGSDVYIGADLSLGSAEQNGVGMFYDNDGEDVYMTPGSKTLGFGGKTTYSGGRNAANIGIFLDRGGKQDTYIEKAWENDAFIVMDNVGFFVDE